MGLRSYLIRDSGRTEFGGVPTLTACAIGPDDSDKIDAVTKDLKLY
ncbi:peptidyl-tRNA hydrolase [Pseudomonadota bacterium]